MIYDDKKFIGSVIRNARKRLNFNQAELAEKLNMTEKNLSNIENGRQYPQVNNFLRIIEILNLSLDDFGVNFSENKSQSELKTKFITKILSSDDFNIKIYEQMASVIDEAISK